MPETIFHYTTQEGLLGIIKSEALWATNVYYLNDSTEIQYAIELIRGEIINYRKRKDYNKFPESLDFLEGSLRMGEHKDFFRIYTCSFSKNGDLLSQWRAYCPKEGGFSVGFDFKQLNALAARQKYRLVKCIYNEREQKELIYNILDKSITAWAKSILAIIKLQKDNTQKNKQAIDQEKTTLKAQVLLNLFQAAPAIKHPAFAEEQEWRLVSQFSMTGDTKAQFRIGKSMIIPYNNFHLSDEDIKLPINSVILGPNQHFHLSTNSVQDLIFAKGLRSCKIVLSSVPHRTL